MESSKTLAQETKGDFKKRTGLSSPDEGDSVAMLCLLVRDRLGFVPGSAPGAVASSSPFSGVPLITGYRPLKSTYLVASPFKYGRI